MKKLEFWLAIFLVLYLLVVGVGAAVAVIVNFPTVSDNIITFPHSVRSSLKFFHFGRLASSDQGLILLALAAGVAGSFLHAAQSLITYVGNASFKASWTAWYFLRPWIGGILGFAIYFAFRAGLVAGANAVNPYGVVALGLLGGWFSKTTTDKLQEVFETLFKTNEDRKRKDKLAVERPIIDDIKPSPIPTNTNEILILGRNFLEGAIVTIGGEELESEFVSEAELKAKIVQRPTAGTEVPISIKNPNGSELPSLEVMVLFE